MCGSELGKPGFETLTSEIIPLLTACRWLERRARPTLRDRRVGGGSIWQIGQRHRVTRVPLGRVAIIATWNYPIQLLGTQLAQALVAGNTVTVKPSERSPETQGLLLDLARDAGMPGSRLERVPASREAGTRLLREQSFDHVVFTGSTAVGRTIAGVLAESLTTSALELSGSDSAIVLADADVKLAARSILFGLSINGGQTCMAPRRVLAERAVLPRLLDAMRAALAEPREMTAVQPDQLERTSRAVSEAIEAGGRRLVDGDETAVEVVVDAPPETALFRGEHFGPAMAVVGVDSPDDALRLHTSVDRRLATAVYTRDVRAGRRLAASLGSTIVTINDCVIPTGHPGVSLGGIGPSGWGLTRGREGLLAMTRPVYVSGTHPRVRTPLSPPTARAARSVRSLVRRWYG